MAVEGVRVILPTSPTIKIDAFGGKITNSWYDYNEIYKDKTIDD